jgi:hypothetical protein
MYIIQCSAITFKASAFSPRSPDCILTCLTDRIVSCGFFHSVSSTEKMSLTNPPRGHTNDSNLSCHREHVCRVRQLVQCSEMVNPNTMNSQRKALWKIGNRSRVIYKLTWKTASTRSVSITVRSAFTFNHIGGMMQHFPCFFKIVANHRGTAA